MPKVNENIPYSRLFVSVNCFRYKAKKENMKITVYNSFVAVAAALMLTGCADLGFGVDIDSGAPGPYYGSGPVVNPYWGWGWDSPAWNLGPVANPVPPPPRPHYPVLNPGIGPVVPPSNPGVNRPSGPVNANPGNRVPTVIDGTMRPGNGGFATPGASTPRR